MKTKLIRKRNASVDLQESELKIYDIPVEDLIDSEENPNTMQDAMFDELVEGIKNDGVDEPIMVMPIYKDGGEILSGKYIIVSGHHRTKAARVAGKRTVPAVIKKTWDDNARKIALVRRNILRGKLDSSKFTELFNDVAKKVDKELLKIQMGFTEKKAFEDIYKSVSKSLTPKQKKKLEEAKENIKNVDDLSSVLNTIFRDHGSELDAGFMVFSFGGKQHHYFQIDDGVNKLLKQFEKEVTEDGIDINVEFKNMLKARISKKPTYLTEHRKKTIIKKRA